MNEERNKPHYSEWVLPSWTSFIPVLGVYPALWLTFLPISPTIGVWAGIAATLMVASLMVAKSARIAVTEDRLQVANASIDRKHVVAVEVVGKDRAFFARGRELNPGAWIHFQGSVGTLALVRINDPLDPTPYWLFSTRDPEALKKSLGY
jgi:hypothetical protein